MDQQNLQAREFGTGEGLRKIFDWLSASPDDESLTPWQKFVVGFDWTTREIGPIATWPPQLRQMILLVMADPTPASFFWGDKNFNIYNENYVELIGDIHPGLFAQDPWIGGFAELWGHFHDILTTQKRTGVTAIDNNALVPIKRHGFLEEIYFDWKLVPVVGPEGWIIGSYLTVVEVTREILSERRISTVRTLSAQLSESRSIKDLWSGIITG
jgi:hypothetical protein